MSEFSSNSWRTSERNRLNFFRKFSYLLCCCCWCNLTVCNQYQVDENPLHLHIHFSLSLFAWNFGGSYNTRTFLISPIRLLYIVRYFKIISIVQWTVCVWVILCSNWILKFQGRSCKHLSISFSSNNGKMEIVSIYISTCNTHKILNGKHSNGGQLAVDTVYCLFVFVFVSMPSIYELNGI